MNIYWKNEKLKRILASEDLLRKNFKLDKKEIREVFKVLDQLAVATNILDLPPRYNCHPLKEGKKLRFYTVDLPSVGGGRGKNRLCFIPVGKYDLARIETITEIEIIDIKNTHKG